MGEFAAPVFPVAFGTIELSPEKENELCDRLLSGAIEANSLRCAVGPGAVDRTVWSGFVEPSDKWGGISEQQRFAVEAWMESEPGIIECVAGEVATNNAEIMRTMDRDPDYPVYIHAIPFLYYVLYTLLLHNAVLDITHAQEDSSRRKRVDIGYVVVSIAIYSAMYCLA